MFKISAQTADFLEKGLSGIPRQTTLNMWAEGVKRYTKAYAEIPALNPERRMHDMVKLAPNVPYRPRWFREPCQGEQWQIYVPHDRGRFGTGYRILMEYENEPNRLSAPTLAGQSRHAGG